MKFDLTRKEYELIKSECLFTDRELEVLEYLIRGWTTVQISIELCLSDTTVTRIRKSITRKIIESNVFDK